MTCPSLLISSVGHHPVDAASLSRLLDYISTSHLVLRLLSMVGIPLAISTVVSPSLATWDFRWMLSKALRVILSFIVVLIGNVGLEPLYYYPTVVCKPLHFIPSKFAFSFIFYKYYSKFFYNLQIFFSFAFFLARSFATANELAGSRFASSVAFQGYPLFNRGCRI